MYNDGEDVDPTTVFSKLQKNKDLLRVGGAPFLHTCMESAHTTANAGSYAQIVRDKWKIRKVNDFGTRAIAIADNVDEVAPMLDRVRTFLDEVDEDQESSSLDFKELYQEWVDAQADPRPAIETPWVELNDRLSGGLQRQRLYVIGARPGCGKTIMLADIARYTAQLHNRSVFFSLELSRDDLMGRILASGARVPYDEITKRRLSGETRAAINRWSAASAEMTLEVDDQPDLTIEDITQRCRIEKQRNGLDVVCIDYCQLISSSKGDNREQQVSHIATRARAIARKLDCAVVLAAQLNRKIEDNGGKPRLPVKSDFRESGGIEQTADAAIILTRPVDENGDESRVPKMNVSLVKNRMGTESTFQLVERFDQARFE